MGFTWKSSRRAKVCLHDVTQQSIVAPNDRFAYALVDINIVSGNGMTSLTFDFATDASLHNQIQRTK